MATVGYWGKARKEGEGYHLLEYHCLDVAAVLEALVRADGVTAQRIERLAGVPLDGILPVLLFFAALHDLGKYASSFQLKRRDVAAALGQDVRNMEDGGKHHTALGLGLYVDRLVYNPGGSPLFARLDVMFDTLEPVMDAAFGHHGTPVDSKALQHQFDDGCGERAREFSEVAGELFGVLPCLAALPEDDEYVFKPLSWLFAGLVVVSDWIGSNEGFFPLVGEDVPLEEYWKRSQRLAREAVNRCGLLHPRPSRVREVGDLLPDLADKTLRPLQIYAWTRAVCGAGPQLHIFEDLTGAGKTEAAILAVYRMMVAGACGGMYVGLPAMATANAMYDRLAEIYRRLFDPEDTTPSLTLAHGTRSIHDRFLASILLEDGQGAGVESEDGRAACSRWLADGRKKALLSPCGVGTLDQALLAALPARHQCLRLLGLSRVVLVADEVHAYDPYTGRLLESLLEFLAVMGSSAVLLSATLPMKKRADLVHAFRKGLLGQGAERVEMQEDHFPLATRVDERGAVHEEPVDCARAVRTRVALTSSEEEVFAALKQAHEDGACACWIRNTVDQAVHARERLIEVHGLPEDRVILAHARFALADRLRIEEDIVSRFGKEGSRETRAGFVLVATQVAENSLDLDFDFLCTDLAPMDSVIQRAGRCRRHEFLRPGGYGDKPVLVLSPEPVADPPADWYGALLDKARFVYPLQSVLWKTARLLKDPGVIALHENARELMEGAYSEEGAPDVLVQADGKALGDMKGKVGMAENNRLYFDQGYGTDSSYFGWDSDVRTPTRLGEERVQLRLCKAVDHGLELWAGPEMTARNCARSEVPVLLKRIGGQKPDADGDPGLSAFVDKMPDACRWSIPVVLRQTEGPDIWTGVIESSGGRKAVTYSEKYGLSVEQGGVSERYKCFAASIMTNLVIKIYMIFLTKPKPNEKNLIPQVAAASP